MPIESQRADDIVAKIQQGNWTDEDVSAAVAEIVRLRQHLKDTERQLDEAEDRVRELEKPAKQREFVMLEKGQLWQCRNNANGVVIQEVNDGVAVWSDKDNCRVSTPVAALEFKLVAEFELMPFKVSADYKPTMMGILSAG